MILLPNGCSYSEPSVNPKNWKTTSASVKEDWYIQYYFKDPADTKKPNGRLFIVKGMNKFKTVEERRFITKVILEDEIKKLHNGYNPWTSKTVPSVETNSEISPNTPFIKALNKARDKVEAVPGTLTDMKSVIKGVNEASQQLGIDEIPVKDISRKHFAAIFEQCKKDNPRFSKNRQNVYRKWLIKLYKILFQFEAVESNPLKDIEKEKITKGERVLPTDKQRRAINLFLKENYYSFWRAIQIFFTSDSREIELFRVQAKHVNLEDQSCLFLVKKGQEERWVRRPIIDAALFLWEEILSECKSGEDYIFSKKLLPGPVQISSTQFGRRWQRHVKGNAKTHRKENSRKKNYEPEKKLNINVDLNSLRHQSITELMDKLDKEYNPIKDVTGLTGHKSGKMVATVYDMNSKVRKHDKVKKAGGLF